MSHQDFIAALPPERKAQLHETSDAPGLVHLAGHAGLIAICTTWIALGWWLWPLALLLQGIAVSFLFTLQHEATHKTPFKTLWINEWVGRLAGLPLFQPFEWFRYFHLAHHRHTNIQGKDPELDGGKPETWRAWVWHVSGLPFWAAMIRITARNALGRDHGTYIPERAKPRIRREAQIMCAVYAAALLSLLVSPLLFWVWILPALLGQPVLRLYLLAEHGRCAFVANMLENTRTTYTNRVIRYLAWNMPYHTEHHTLPQVPFHKLPDLHAEMQGHHKVTSQGYTRFTRDFTKGLHP